MKSKLTNVHNELIRLFAKKDGVEQQVDILPGQELVVDDYETRTIRAFKMRGFVTMETITDKIDSIGGKLDNMLSTFNKTVDDSVDPNNDEALDKMHTTESISNEHITDLEYLQKNLFESLKQPVMSSFEVVENEVEQYVEGGYIKGEWTDEDVAFLRKYYPTKGRKYCSTHLNRNESSVQKKINALGLKKKKKRK